MEKIAIITDSCADVAQEYRDKYDIYVLPMVILSEDKEYHDGIDITSEDVYQMQESQDLKTASPTGSDVMEMFAKIRKNGYTHAIIILLASGLSGTYNSVRLLAESEEELTVSVFDGKSGSLGYGAVAVALAQFRDAGMSFADLNQKAEELIQNSFVFFAISSLEHLEKGGRIGKAAAFVGNLMKIKPILSFEKEQGEIIVPAKVHGAKALPGRLHSLVDKLVEEHPDQEFLILVADGGLPQERDELEQQLKEDFPQMKECLHAKIGAALSVYLGSGLLGAGVLFL